MVRAHPWRIGLMQAGMRKELGLASTHALLRGMTAPDREEPVAA